MDFPDAQDLKALVAALAPGLIILGVRQMFIAGPTPPLQDRALAYAAVSAVYYAVATPLLTLLEKRTGLDPWLSNAIEYVVAPAAIGAVFAFATSADWTSKMWRWTGLQPVHHVPTAWDYAFSRLRTGTYIMVTLNDGSQIAGHYAETSFASSSTSERDLLIGDVWEVAEGKWSRPAAPKSVLLCGKDIRIVELFHGEDRDQPTDTSDDERDLHKGIRADAKQGAAAKPTRRADRTAVGRQQRSIPASEE